MRTLFVVIVIVFLASCRTVTDNNMNKLSSTAEKDYPVVLIAGGFNSCPSDGILDATMRAGKTSEMYDLYMNSKIPSLLHKIHGRPASVLTVCFTGIDSVAKSLATSISMRYAWNARDLKPDLPSVKSVGLPQGDLIKDNVSFLASLKAALQTEMRQEMDSGNAPQFYLIGHSYGGFTAMQIAFHFKDYVNALVTLDPISILDCQAGDLSTQILKTVSANHPGCLSFPKDKFSRDAIKKIDEGKNTKFRWLNIFQSYFAWLHSSDFNFALPKVTENTMLKDSDFNNIVLDSDYHSQVARLPGVWSNIENFLTKNFK